MAKRKRYRPHPLKRGVLGKERCVKVGAADRGTPLTLCVIRRKFGYEGRLYPRGGEGGVRFLPVPTGRARTMKGAISQARQFVRRVNQTSRRAR